MSKKKDDKQQPLPPRQVLPKTYLPVELENGNAIIPRDFFISMCPNKLPDDWVVLSVALALYFETAAIGSNTNVVNTNQPTGKNTLGVWKAWLHKVMKIIFGNQYRDTVRMGWNNGLSNKMPKNTPGASAARGMDSGVNFSFTKEKIPPQ